MWSTAERPLRPPSDRRAYLVGEMGMLVALGLVLQIIEGTIPPILPLPGAKLGLANRILAYWAKQIALATPMLLSPALTSCAACWAGCCAAASWAWSSAPPRGPPPPW